MGWTFNTCVRALLKIQLRDTQCGLKGFRREALERIGASLTTEGFATDVEMFLVARALGLRLSEVPVHVTYRSAKSSVKLIRSGVAMAGELLRLAARRALGRYSPARVAAASAARSQPKPAARSSRRIDPLTTRGTNESSTFAAVPAARGWRPAASADRSRTPRRCSASRPRSAGCGFTRPPARDTTPNLMRFGVKVTSEICTSPSSRSGAPT